MAAIASVLRCGLFSMVPPVFFPLMFFVTAGNSALYPLGMAWHEIGNSVVLLAQMAVYLAALQNGSLVCDTW